MYATATVPDPRCYQDALDEFPHPCDPHATLANVTAVKDGGAARLVRIEKITDRAERARLVQHAQMFTSLCHPNVVGLREVRVRGAMTYAVTDHFDAVRLSTVLEEARRHEGGPGLPLGVALRIVVDVLEGLAALHETFADETPRLIHGELQPSSIIVGVDGRARLDRLGGVATTDARTTKVGDKDASYRAPEQWIGDSLDERTDLYAVGAMLWELIAGRKLFAGTQESTLFAMMRGEVPAPGGSLRVAPELFALCRRALAPRRAARHGSAAAFAGDIRALANHFMIPFAREDVIAYIEVRFAEDLRVRRSSVRVEESRRVPVNSPPPSSPIPLINRRQWGDDAPLGNEEPTLTGLNSLAELVRSINSADERRSKGFEAEATTTAFQRSTTPVPPISVTMVSGRRYGYQPEAVAITETAPMVGHSLHNSSEPRLPLRPALTELESSYFDSHTALLPRIDPAASPPPRSSRPSGEQPDTVRRPLRARRAALAACAIIAIAAGFAAAALSYDSTLGRTALGMLNPSHTGLVASASTLASPSGTEPFPVTVAVVDDPANQVSNPSGALPTYEPETNKASPLPVQPTAPPARQPLVYRPRPRRAPASAHTAPSEASATDITEQGADAATSVRSTGSTEPRDLRTESAEPSLEP